MEELYATLNAARIAFTERVCQGTENNKGSPSATIFVMLKPIKGHMLLTVWEVRYVKK